MARMPESYWESLRSFGEIVRAYRWKKGARMSRRELAAYCGVSVATMSLIERGKIPPSKEVFDYIVECFDIDERNREAISKSLPRLRPKRGAPKGERDEIVDKWLAGRRVFRDTIDRWRAAADLTQNQLADEAGISRVVMTQIFNMTYAIPRNGVCRRLAKACEKKPLRLFLLRMISVSEPAIRRGLVEIFFPEESELLKEMIRETAHGVVPIELGVRVRR
jgi:transcriptional regulator with XRE-family HTH domain